MSADSKAPEAPNPTGIPRNVSPADIDSLARSDAGQLVLRVRGQAEPVNEVKVARCFPWSMPGEYVSIRDKDGKEICLITTLAELKEGVRVTVLQELHDKVFNPKIRRVLSHKSEFGVTSIAAETDRGEVTFEIRSRDDIRHLSNVRALFRDADGNTYELEDVTALDPASRKWLREYF